MTTCAFAIRTHTDTNADALKLINEGHVDEAVNKLQAILKIHNDAEASNLLCRAYYSGEQWDEAIKACEHAVELEPNNASYHLWLGRAYGLKAERCSWFTALRMAGRVRDHFEKAVALNPNFTEARVDLAEYYVEAPGIVGGSKDKARKLMEEIASKDPATAHWITARIAEEEDRYDDAETEYKAEVAAGSDHSVQWVDLAGFYRRRKRFDEMESALQSAMKAKTPHGQLFFDVADCLLSAGRNFPLAIELMNRYLASQTVEEAPASRAHLLMGRLMEKQGNYEGAKSQYQSALALATHYSEAQDALHKLEKK